jgi:hypothetical protein
MTALYHYDAASALRVLADALDAHPDLPRSEFIAVHSPYAPDVPVAASFRFEKAEDADERRANVAAVESWAKAWGAPITPQVGGNRGCQTEIDGVQIRALRPAYEMHELDDGCHHEHDAQRAAVGPNGAP